MGKLSFHGGVHPPEEKELTEGLALEVMPDPAQVFVPLAQHLGKPAKVLVKKGDFVRQGQLLAEADGFISAPVHSPVTGTVAMLQNSPLAGGGSGQVIAIKPGPPPAPKVEEGEEAPPLPDSSPMLLPPLDPEQAPVAELLERVRQAGIVGQGGAAFPTAVKLSPPKDKPIEWLIINGCECEPYLTRDFRLMIERTADLARGMKLLARICGAKRIGIGIEGNKPEAIAAMRAQAGIEVFELKTKYPQGGEKMLIVAATGRKVPAGGLPMDVGCVIQNVGTALAALDAVVKGEMPRQAALTVSGHGIKRPRNLYVTIGTPVQEVIDFCGGTTDDACRVVLGGPMMGPAAYSLEAPIVKASSGILVLTNDEVKEPAQSNCLKCCNCVSVCPLSLLPSRLARLSQFERWEEARDLDVMVCMECGTCAFACPAHIPLVQWLRLAKTNVRKLPRNEG